MALRGATSDRSLWPRAAMIDFGATNCVDRLSHLIWGQFDWARSFRIATARERTE